MHLKAHQKEPFRKELRLGIIWLAALAFIFAATIIYVQMSTLKSLFAIVVFLSLATPFVLSANPTLIKVLRTDVQQSLSGFFILLGVLFILSSLYAATTGQYTTFKFVASGIWLIISAGFIFILRRQQAPSLFDYLYVFILWLPMEFSLIGGSSLPPGAAIMQPISIIGSLMLIFSYLVVREFDIGFSFHLKGDDLRVVVLNFLLFFFTAIIIGMILGFLVISDRVPSLWHMISTFIIIFFFIAIPEELLFRGVIYRLLLRQFEGRRYAVGKALAISSLLFGLAHPVSTAPPFIAIHFGALGTWHAPWAFMLLAGIAGMFYGLVFIRTKNIIAAAAIHVLVVWSWLIFFSGK